MRFKFYLINLCHYNFAWNLAELKIQEFLTVIIPQVHLPLYFKRQTVPENCNSNRRLEAQAIAIGLEKNKTSRHLLMNFLRVLLKNLGSNSII